MRVTRVERPADRLEIVDFEPGLAAAFRDLNLEWLQQYFAVEPLDEIVLGDPLNVIVRPGGSILFARLGDRVVGTVALKKQAAGVFELTKMAVTAAARGCGIGRCLIDAAIARFLAADGQRLYLETHSSLHPALALYESVGFVREAPPDNPDYARCNVYMVYKGAGRNPSGTP